MRGCRSADATAAKVEEYEIRALSTAARREIAAAEDPIAAMERCSGEEGEICCRCGVERRYHSAEHL
jgi:hypothetical protein